MSGIDLLPKRMCLSLMEVWIGITAKEVLFDFRVHFLCQG